MYHREVIEFIKFLPKYYITMLRLPKSLPKNLASELKACASASVLEECFEHIAECVLKGFRAKDVILAFVSEVSVGDEPSIALAKTSRDNMPSDYQFDFPTKWITSGIHQSVIKDLQNRFSPVSYSSFSWPYASTIGDESGVYSCPKEYTLLIPFSSELIVTKTSEQAFSGYFAVLFDAFPKFDDEPLQLIVTLPSLMSEIVSVYMREKMIHKNSYNADCSNQLTY
jgi:hypothetical protein